MDCYVSWSHNLNPNTPTIAFFSKSDIEPGTELTFDYKADMYNRNEVKGLPNILLEDDEMFFRGDPSARYIPDGTPVVRGEVASVATGSSNDENEEFASRRNKRTRKPGPASREQGHKKDAKPVVKQQHHLTSEFHQKCYCGSPVCRMYLS